MPDEQRFPVFLTGEQLNIVHYILRQDRHRFPELNHDHSILDAAIRSVKEALEKSDYRKKRDEEIRRNLERYRLRRREYRKYYDESE